jgi:hypothetical protein
MACTQKTTHKNQDGTITETEEVLSWDEIRYWRDHALFSSDHFTRSDRWDDLTSQQQTELKAFRKTLRDIPQTYSKEEDVIFPVKPSWLNIDVNDYIFTGK